jgi:4-amino-4-deoxychorismate lyase
MSLLAVAVGGRGVVPTGEPVLRADDEALLRGRAAFETLRVYGGVPFRLDAHLDRLSASAGRIGLPPVDREQLRALAGEALAAAGVDSAVLRLYWTPTPTALALVSELPDHDELRARGQRIVTLPIGVSADLRKDAPWLLGGVKSTSYAVNMAAEAEAQRRGADDAVFLAEGEIVLEGPTTNVWWRKGETLYTPAVELGILAGVTRAVILERAPYAVREGAFHADELRSADEAFTSSSVREVMPITWVDGVDLARGEAAARCQALLREAAE